MQAREGGTFIHGESADQAALHGPLQTLRDLRSPLISVIQIEADPRDEPGLMPQGATSNPTKGTLT